jgi:hypothetical protein
MECPTYLEFFLAKIIAAGQAAPKQSAVSAWCHQRFLNGL